MLHAILAYLLCDIILTHAYTYHRICNFFKNKNKNIVYKQNTICATAWWYSTTHIYAICDQEVIKSVKEKTRWLLDTIISNIFAIVKEASAQSFYHESFKQWIEVDMCLLGIKSEALELDPTQ